MRRSTQSLSGEILIPKGNEHKEFRRDRLDRKKFEKDRSEPKPRKDYAKTEGIEPSKIDRRKAAGECLRCAWPSDRKGNHRVKDCIRPMRLDKGTASYPKAKDYQKMKVAGMEVFSKEENSSNSESESSESES